MSADGPNFLWLIGALVLAVSALTARRPSLGAVLRSLAGWAVVLAIVARASTHRPQIEGLVEAAAERIGVGEQETVGDTVRITMGVDGNFWARATIADGTVAAQRGRAERVSIGTITTEDLGVVVSPAFAGLDVLGMNFLSRLGSWRVEGRTLILEPKRPRSNLKFT